VVEQPCAPGCLSLVAKNPDYQTHRPLCLPTCLPVLRPTATTTTTTTTTTHQALPQQQTVSWKSLYPAVGEGSRGKVYQAVNLDTGACVFWHRSCPCVLTMGTCTACMQAQAEASTEYVCV
jgi:hypothetical protein